MVSLPASFVLRLSVTPGFRWVPTISRAIASSRFFRIASLSAITFTVANTFVQASLSATAADRLSVRLGIVEQSVNVADLETFASSGNIPKALSLYRPLLTQETHMALNSYLPFDPTVSDELVADLLQSSTGEQIFEALELAIPDSSPDKIETALKQASQNPQGLSLLGFIAAYPDNTLTIDASAAVTLASQLNLPYWQRGLLNSILIRELTVDESLDQIAFDPTERGPEQVNRQTFKIKDKERDRTIPVDLYWNEWSQGPTVVLSHGFAADRRFLGYLAEHLASYGLTVAAIEHPSSNVAWLMGMSLGVKGGDTLSDILPITEFLDRPKDVSLLLNTLEKMGEKHEGYSNPFSTDQVTVIGHSLGGYTALALAGATLDLEALKEFCTQHSVMTLAPADWLQCRAVDLAELDSETPLDLHDPRITQVIAMNPVMARIFGESGLANISVPTLITAASEDSVTPAVTQQLLPFTHFQNETQYLLTAIGATHLSMGDPSNLNPGLTENIVLRERSRQETEQMRQLMQGLSLAFIKQQTPEAELYKTFLSSAYVQSWSNERVKIRFSQSLPKTLEQWLRMVERPMERVVSATLPKKKLNHEERSPYTLALHGLASGIVLMLFMPPAGLSLSSIRALTRIKSQRRLKAQRPKQPKK